MYYTHWIENNILFVKDITLGYRFSAFWLRSSVVSWELSTKTMPFARDCTIKFCCAPGASVNDVTRFFTGRKDLCPTDVKCVQRLPDGSHLASFTTPEPVRKLLAEDVVYFGFTPVVVTAPDTPKKVVKIFNLLSNSRTTRSEWLLRDMGMCIAYGGTTIRTSRT